MIYKKNIYACLIVTEWPQVGQKEMVYIAASQRPYLIRLEFEEDIGD